MQQRTCNVDGLGDGLTCWYVNPTLAQGSKGWTGGTYNGTSTGVTPLPKPFYVVEANGREYRIWIQDDTGYDIGITASKPITANARTSLTWTAQRRAVRRHRRPRGVCTGGASPIGSFDVASPAGPEKIRVGGLGPRPGHGRTRSPCTSTSTRSAPPSPPTSPRPDVAAAYPGYGDLHGFSALIPAAPGPHQVCAYGINVQGGSQPAALGCYQVTVTGTADAARSTWPRRHPARSPSAAG